MVVEGVGNDSSSRVCVKHPGPLALMPELQSGSAPSWHGFDPFIEEVRLWASPARRQGGLTWASPAHPTPTPASCLWP